MTSVWFAASGSGEDGDEYDVHEVFATHEAAQAHCDRPGKPKWECRYVQEWKVTGSILTDAEREDLQMWLAECLRQCSTATEGANEELAERWQGRAKRAAAMIERLGGVE